MAQGLARGGRADAGPLRLAFAGTPAFAAVALEQLHLAGFAIPLVFTQPDRPAGRGLRLQPSPVKLCAQRMGAQVMQPQGLRLDGRFAADALAAQQALEQHAPDVMVVAAYGLILPAWTLALPRLGCLNIHASLLPRWRGAAPIHRAIEAGDAETGITIMQMDAGLDTGDVLLMQSLPIAPDDTTAVLQDRLADLGGQLVVRALHGAAASQLVPMPQPEAGVCYAHKVSKAEATLDWAWPARVIERRVRAFDPFPGVNFEVAGSMVKLWCARVRDDLTGSPGDVLAHGAQGLTVACGAGALELLELQSPGGKRLPAEAWLHSHPGLPARLAQR
jgi:methionyl-tRNA formyltransferase